MKKAAPKKAARNKPVRNKRKQVLEVATNCFLTNGYDGTSVNVMARDAGMSKESIYRHFGSKENLFKAVVEQELEVYNQGMQETASDYQDQSLEEALTHVAETILKIITHDRALALRRLIFQMAASGSNIGKHYYQTGPQVAHLNLKVIFEYHLARSKLKSRFEPEKLSQYFLGMLLHPTTLQKECGQVKRITGKEIKRRCREVVQDFISIYFPA